MFWELTKSRDAGESMSAIKQSEYLAYWESYGIWGIEERSHFQRVVTILDDTFMTYTFDQRAKKMEQMQSKSPSARGGLTLK